MLASILALSPLLGTLILGSPTPHPANTTLPDLDLTKRAAPSIRGTFNIQEFKQIQDGFKDALQLASYVTTRPRPQLDAIMGKYFDLRDIDIVLGVFQNIVKPDKDGNIGNDLLSTITVMGDSLSEKGKYTCETDDDVAELRYWDSGSPTLILCPSALKHGGISKGYSLLPFIPYTVPAVVCENFDDEVSWKMDTLGATILHEYIHFKMLVNPPLTVEAVDSAYGPYECQTYNKGQALHNPDSYAWMATENMWTVICRKEFEAALEDSKDPFCGLGSCIRK